MSKSKVKAPEGDAPKKKWIAVLSPEGRLIGKNEVTLDVPGIDPGDLPTNGRYKWDAEAQAFIPLGHGFGQIAKKNALAPHTLEIVIASLIEKMGDKAPLEAREWFEWYNSNIRKREQELSIAQKLRG